MTVPERAAKWAKDIANDNSHGYDQANRWGPDYDCSSLVISAYKQAGVDLTCTYTGNMRRDMLAHGFRDITLGIDLASGSGLQVGDVLLRESSHTAIVCGNNQIVNASGNETGGSVGGKTGDQTGNEIRVRSYYNCPWDCVLRYDKDAVEPIDTSHTPDRYTVQAGDTLWGIAERFLGAGERYVQLMTANNLTSSMIYPGLVLKIPTGNTIYRTVQITIKNETLELLTIMADGWNKTVGEVIDALMEDAV